jgi:2-keto-4-pentenoate hydratase/2-oxohepta-3-ene-1,7-dioic acid hydratase in catechol pathway
MRFLNYQLDGSIHTGLLNQDGDILDLKKILQFIGEDASLAERDADFFENFSHLKPILTTFLETKPDKIAPTLKSDVKLLSPVLNPSKIVCLGLNYRDHAEETGTKFPKLPMLFSKASTSIIGPEDPIIIPQVRKKIDKDPKPIQFLDYEVELAVVIGERCKKISVQDASNYILGYTILNDVSARMEQMADKQFFRSKSFDTFAPLGPWLVTSDQIRDPMNLRIQCSVNGEIMQNSSTANMNFNVYEIISFISEAITLVPGDLIGTGTPAGVGAAKKPPKPLKSGDIIEMTVENIGTLRNRVQ